MKISGIVISAIISVTTSSYALAKNIPYRSSATLSVGQSIIIKGVRANCGAKTPPSFASLNRLPKPKFGKLSDGGAGTVSSRNCEGLVPARAIKYTAIKQGKDFFVVYDDRVTITVK